MFPIKQGRFDLGPTELETRGIDWWVGERVEPGTLAKQLVRKGLSCTFRGRPVVPTSKVQWHLSHSRGARHPGLQGAVFSTEATEFDMATAALVFSIGVGKVRLCSRKQGRTICKRRGTER